MRKFLGVSLVAVLAVSPMMAQANVATVATNDTTVGVASTKYVKEAYNAMAGAVNAELANKQGTMSAGKGIDITSNKISVDAGTGLGFDGTGDNAKLIVTGLKNAQIASDAAIDQSKISGLTTALSGKQATLSTTQLAAANSGITAEKVSTYEGYATSKQDALTAGDGVDITNNVVSVDPGTGLVLNTTTHKVDVSGLKNAQIASDAAIDQSKISGLTSALSGKQATLTAGKGVDITSNVVTVDAGTGLSYEGTGNTAKLAVSGLKNAQIASDAAIEQSKISGLTAALNAKQGTLTAGDGVDITNNVVSVDPGTGLVLNTTTHKVDVSGLKNAQIASDAAIDQSKISGLTSALSGKQATLSTAQLAAANSGIDSTKVAKYEGYETTINSIGSKVLTIYNGWNGGAAPDTTSTVALTTPAS